MRITKDTEYGGEEELVVLGKGEYFGELALYDDGGERRANAIALAPGVECLTLDRTSVQTRNIHICIRLRFNESLNSPYA